MTKISPELKFKFEKNFTKISPKLKGIFNGPDVCTTDRYNNTYYKLCRLYNLFIVLIFPISRCNLAMECLGVGTGAVDWTTVVVSVGNNTLHL